MFAFFHGVLHFLCYIWLDKFFDLPDIVKDLTKRPFIMAGFCAFILMIPLAATSTAWSMRKMGERRWQLLHRAVYLSAAAAVLHFWWKVKANTTVPLTYAVIFVVLLIVNLFTQGKAKS